MRAQCAVAEARQWQEDGCHHQLSMAPPCCPVLKSLLWGPGSAFSYASSCYGSELNSSQAKSQTNCSATAHQVWVNPRDLPSVAIASVALAQLHI